MKIGDSAIGHYDHILLGSKVMLSDDGNHIAIASKIHVVIGFNDLHPTTEQMHERSVQNWGNTVKDDVTHDAKSEIGHGSNVVLSDDGNLLVISSNDNDHDKNVDRYFYMILVIALASKMKKSN